MWFLMFAFCVAISVLFRIERDFPTENEGRNLKIEKYVSVHSHALLHRVSVRIPILKLITSQYNDSFSALTNMLILMLI